jgi:vancomycin permeability regulator SanA
MPFQQSFRRLLRKALVLLLILGFGTAGLLVWRGLTDNVSHADVALVLGSKVNPDGKPSAGLQARLDKAFDLYQKGFFPKIIVSGGTGKEGFPEGTVMRDYLVGKGVPAEAILVDNEGWTTRASAVNTAHFLEQHQLASVLVVTQYFHIPRSKLALKKEGITRIYNAHSPHFGLRDIYSIFRELPAYVKYSFHPDKRGATVR